METKTTPSIEEINVEAKKVAELQWGKCEPKLTTSIENILPLTEELRRSASAIYLACHEDVAGYISSLMQRAANEIERLENLTRLRP